MSEAPTKQVMDREEIELRKLWLDHWPGHITLVEHSFGSTPGTPDAFAAYYGSGLLHPVASWVEFKVADEKGCFELTSHQPIWHRAYNRFASNAFFVVMDREGFWTLPSSLVMDKIEGRKGNVLQMGGRKVRWDCLADVPSLLPLLVQGRSYGAS